MLSRCLSSSLVIQNDESLHPWSGSRNPPPHDLTSNADVGTRFGVQILNQSLWEFQLWGIASRGCSIPSCQVPFLAPPTLNPKPENAKHKSPEPQPFASCSLRVACVMQGLNRDILCYHSVFEIKGIVSLRFHICARKLR